MVGMYFELTCRLAANRDFTNIRFASCAMPVEVDLATLVKVAATRVMIPTARRIVDDGLPFNVQSIQCLAC